MVFHFLGRETEKSEKLLLGSKVTVTYEKTSPTATSTKPCGAENHFKSRALQSFKKFPSFILNNHGFQNRSCNRGYLKKMKYPDTHTYIFQKKWRNTFYAEVTSRKANECKNPLMAGEIKAVSFTA